MIQLSAKTQNACLALMELTRRYADRRPVPLKCIAEAQSISSQFLVQILSQLKRAGLVDSIRGPSGGYKLARDPSSITLLEIVVSMDGYSEITTPEQATPDSSVVLETWRELNDTVHERLSQITLLSLSERALGRSNDSMYYI